MKELWKPFPGYESTHMISSLGRVRSLDRYVNCARGESGKRLARGKLLRTTPGSVGYPKVQLTNRGKTIAVHRAVATAFIPNPYSLPQVNHMDGVKTNCVAENLEWVTGSQNMLHCHANGLQRMNPQIGADHPSARSVIAFNTLGEEVGRWGSVSDCARDMGIRRNSIFRVLWGKRNWYHGMKFIYP